MKFQPGQSGNPSGRPKGALNKQTQLIKLLEPRGEEIINKMVELALEGDSNALRLCVERLLPKAKLKPIELELPTYDEDNFIENTTEILNQILIGNVTPDDGRKVISLIEEHNTRIELGRMI